MRLDDALADEEAEAGAARVGAAGLPEALEHPVEIARGDPLPRVGDEEADAVRVRRGADTLTLLAELGLQRWSGIGDPATSVRYGRGGANHLEVPKDESNPYFTFDPAKCIVCNRCVRACEEVQGTFALTIQGRGFDSKVSASIDERKILLVDDVLYTGRTTRAALDALIDAGCDGLKLLLGKPDLSMILNGTLAGLVAITAGCNAVSVNGSIIIGFAAGVIVVYSVLFFVPRERYDSRVRERVGEIDAPVGPRVDADDDWVQVPSTSRHILPLGFLSASSRG